MHSIGGWADYVIDLRNARGACIGGSLDGVIREVFGGGYVTAPFDRSLARLHESMRAASSLLDKEVALPLAVHDREQLAELRSALGMEPADIPNVTPNDSPNDSPDGFEEACRPSLAAFEAARDECIPRMEKISDEIVACVRDAHLYPRQDE